MPLALSTPVKFIKRIGDRVAAGLAERGIVTVEDLLYHLPFRYEDRLHPKPLSQYNAGDMASLIGEVRGTVLLRTRSAPIFEMTVAITPPATPGPTNPPATPGAITPPATPGGPRLASETWVRTNPPATPGLITPATPGGPRLASETWVPTNPPATPGPITPPATPGGPRLASETWVPTNPPATPGPITPPTTPGGPRLASETWVPTDPNSNPNTNPNTDPTVLRTPPPPHILETVKCMWFHGTYLKDKFQLGQQIALYGKLEGSRSGNALNAVPGSTRFKMVQPTFEILPDANATGEDAEFTMLEMGRIVPIYESLGGKTPWGAKLTSRWHRRVLWTVFRDLEETSTKTDETLPTTLRTALDLPTRIAALRDLHFPPAGTSMIDLMSARTPAHRRLIFEEFFYLELGLELKRRKLRTRIGTTFHTNDNVRRALKQVLPFKPTAAQKRVLGEIVTDMRSPRPMRRLLQGDVGSGKTIVALQAAIVAIENGYQAALMAPTEILATQHFLSARKLLADKISPHTNRHYRITLLTGSLDERSKRDARARISRGETDLAIGTHALVEDKVEFPKLGLVIVDEQHRFGVQQRFQLMRKQNTNSGDPSSRTASSSDKAGPQVADAVEADVLVMTATPIPRTLALTVYGDLDTSVLDELPPGRTPITTRRMPEERSAEVWDFVRKQVAAGRQAYIVYPIIEGATDDQPELDFASETRNDTTRNETIPDQASSDQASADSKKLLSGIDTMLQKYDGYGAAEAVLKPRSTRIAASLAAKSLKAPKRPTTPETPAVPTKAPKPKLRSATEMHDHLAANELTGLKLGLLHGRMSSDDKEVTMARFKRGELDVLVSTTVIEVGVDVPNATLMVIEHAERFGLAQLHQLRGRVGRGAQKSFCVLLTGERISPEAEQRLDAMVRTQNGFELAELDLQLRGPGEFFGTRQAGLPDLRVASLTRDRELLELAKQQATNFAETQDPNMPREEIDAVWTRLKQQWQRRYGLVEA